MPFRAIDTAMRASGQITSNFLTQASWRLEIRQPPTSLCTTSNFPTNAMVLMVEMVIMVQMVIMVEMVTMIAMIMVERVIMVVMDIMVA